MRLGPAEILLRWRHQARHHSVILTCPPQNGPPANDGTKLEERRYGWHPDSTKWTVNETRQEKTKTESETESKTESKTESETINKNEPWTDKLKMNWLTAQTNWIISKWASPKKVTAGWARRDVICRALCCLFLIFEQRSYCPASISRTSWPPTPAKTNSGTLTCYTTPLLKKKKEKVTRLPFSFYTKRRWSLLKNVKICSMGKFWFRHKMASWYLRVSNDWKLNLNVN
jgi:hypothetical protein